MKTIRVASILAVGLTVAASAVPSLGTGLDPAAGGPQSDGVPIANREQVTTEQTNTHLAGNHLVTGRVKEIRGNQMEVTIGNPKSLYIPLKPAADKEQTFKPGDLIVITLNDQNALVDYHLPGEISDPQVIEGQLATPLTVGLDKAVIVTSEGTKTFMVTERAKSKLGAIPIGVPAVFLVDETGQLVDAQPGGLPAAVEATKAQKSPIRR